MAFLFAEYMEDDVDILKLMKMVLIHDLIEIYAGDTFCFDAVEMEDKDECEQVYKRNQITLDKGPQVFKDLIHHVVEECVSKGYIK